MTQFYYLSSKKPLKVGMFGQNPATTKKGSHTFKTLGDEAGIYIEKTEHVSIHLQLPYQVQIHARLGSFGNDKDDITACDLKCLITLLYYIKESMHSSFSLEWFTCWAGEENENILQQKSLTLAELTSPLQLILQDREYLRIVKKKW